MKITNEIVEQYTIKNNILRIINKEYDSFEDNINLKKFKEININRCNIKIITSGIFSNLPNLEIINLSSNQYLKKIEKLSFEGCINLKDIRLSFNRSLTDIEEDPFNGCNFLRKINLSNCNFKKISPGIFNNLPNLAYIDISNNKRLTCIEGIFYDCDFLQTINLSHCNLKKIYPGTINNPCIFDRLPNLCEINLSHNKNLKYIEKGSFNGCNVLRNINISNCNLQKISSGIFSDLLGLNEINLSYNKNLKCIEKNSFENCNYLTDLDISHCNLQFIQLNRSKFTINLDYNNLIYRCGININVSFNNNYLNNEEHQFLTKIRDKLNKNYEINNQIHYNNSNNNINNNNNSDNNNMNNSLPIRIISPHNSHYNYFKYLDRNNIDKVNLIVEYILDTYEINNNLFKKNIIIIFYIVNILLTKVNIFKNNLSLETLVENFIDYFLNFLKYRLIEKKITLPGNIFNISTNFIFNDKFILNFLSNENFVKCIFYIIKELSKNYNNINIHNKIHDIVVFIMTPVFISKHNLNKKRMIRHLLKNNSLMNRLSREELEKVKFNKLIQNFNIEIPSMNTKQKIYIYNKIKNLNTNNLSKKINKIKIDIIKSKEFHDKFKSKNKTVEERKRVQNEIKKIFYFINNISNKYINKKEILFLE